MIVWLSLSLFSYGFVCSSEEAEGYGLKDQLLIGSICFFLWPVVLGVALRFELDAFKECRQEREKK